MNLSEVTWRNLTVFTSENIKILNSVSGQFRSGTITAIMGPEGSGKTSLINVFTGKIPKSLIVQGEILINSRPRQPDLWARTTADVEQYFYAYGLQTVYETLKFAALCKMPDEDKIEERIEEILLILNLENLRNRFMNSLNYSERIRVNIGLEFVEDPTILFLDEPTTDLDTISSLHLLEVLKSLAYADKTIILTLHEPTFEMLKFIDNFIFLCSGNIIFNGKLENCINFFKNLGFETPLNHNPACHFVDVLTFNERNLEVSELSYRNIFKIKEAWNKIEPKYEPTVLYPIVHEKNPRIVKTFKNLLLREFSMFKRDIPSLKFRVIEKLITAILIGLTFVSMELQNVDLLSLAEVISFLITNEIFTISSPVFDQFSLTNPVIKREKLAGFYNGYEAYYSRVIFLLIYHLLFEIPFLTIVYFLIGGFNKNFGTFIIFILILADLAVFSISFSLSFGVIFENAEYGKIIEVSVNLIFILYGGIFINPNKIPGFLKWMIWLSPAFYTFNAVIQNQLTNEQINGVKGEVVIDDLGGNYIGILPSCMILLGASLLFQLLGAIGVEKIVTRNLKILPVRSIGSNQKMFI